MRLGFCSETRKGRRAFLIPSGLENRCCRSSAAYERSLRGGSFFHARQSDRSSVFFVARLREPDATALMLARFYMSPPRRFSGIYRKHPSAASRLDFAPAGVRCQPALPCALPHNRLRANRRTMRLGKPDGHACPPFAAQRLTIKTAGLCFLEVSRREYPFGCSLPGYKSEENSDPSPRCPNAALTEHAGEDMIDRTSEM